MYDHFDFWFFWPIDYKTNKHVKIYNQLYEFCN